MRATLRTLAERLQRGETTSRELVEACLARIADPNGQGTPTFLKVNAESARAAAEACDRARARREALPPYAGIPISIKDLFDVAGELTTAGSKLLRDAAPAARDATAVARVKAAGFIVMGRTNMTEFAFSGLGLNIHYGTPSSPFGRATGRIPGGSSSGAGVSIADEMAYAALGTDTGGSCRIPAALCGVVGFKPTAKRVPLDGAFPLSPTLDSIGPLANSVECCAIVDSILANESAQSLNAVALRGLRLAVPQSLVLDEMDDIVASTFLRALAKLSAAGADVVEIALPQFLELPALNAKGGISAPEAYAIHRAWIEQRAGDYDPRVLKRILRAKEQEAADYVQLMWARAKFIKEVSAALEPFDAAVMPTVPLIAPSIASLADDESYRRANALMLRNTSIVNFLDGCAISIPCHDPGAAPVGLMLAGLNGSDQRLLSIAAAVERHL